LPPSPGGTYARHAKAIADFNGILADDEEAHFLVPAFWARKESADVEKFTGEYLGYDDRDARPAWLRDGGFDEDPRPDRAEVAYYSAHVAGHTTFIRAPPKPLADVGAVRARRRLGSAPNEIDGILDRAVSGACLPSSRRRTCRPASRTRKGSYGPWPS
jgi:hypothetical protein